MTGPVGATYTSVLVQAADGSLQQALVLTSDTRTVAARDRPTEDRRTGRPRHRLRHASRRIRSPLRPTWLPRHRPHRPIRWRPRPWPRCTRWPLRRRRHADVRRLLHLDVILPLIAVAIVLVVLLAWLG